LGANCCKLRFFTRGCARDALCHLCYTFSLVKLGVRVLAAKGFNTMMDGVHLSCSQFANNLCALLPHEEALPTLLNALSMFGDATGQRLNPAKTQALYCGDRCVDQPVQAHGVSIIASVKALGVRMGQGTWLPEVDWDNRREPVVLSRFSELARLPISAIGQGMASLTIWGESVVVSCRVQRIAPASIP
jgi:hypothetical protein